MEVKHKHIELLVQECKKMPDIAVLIGMHYECCPLNLIKLKSNNPSEELVAGAEGAALGFALYEYIRDKLIGSPLELSKSRVSRLECNAINGEFTISWNTQGSYSMLRKTMGLVISTLDPMKLYSKYAENIKLLGGSANRNVFHSKAAEMIAAINKNVKFIAIGRIKTDKPKLMELLEKISKKQPQIQAPHPKEMEAPPKHPECKCDYPKIKVSGIAAVAVADYIRSKSGGMGIEFVDGYIIVYNHSWHTKENSLKKINRIKDYVRQKYEKLGDSFPCIFAYMAMTQGLAECCTITDIIKKAPKASSMVELLKKHI